MVSLSNSLKIAIESMNASTGGIQVTNNNIANANTAGYSRQVASTTMVSETDLGNYSLGNGIVFSGYQSIRSELLQTRIRQETEAQSGADAQLTSLQTIETSFTSSSSSSEIGTEINALFTSISDLSTNPSSSSLRQAVLTAADNLASVFHAASHALTVQQSSLNEQVSSDVDLINSLCEQIAALNPKVVAEQVANNGEGGEVQDSQEALLLQLSALTQVNVIQTNSGVTVTAENGSPLVVGANSCALSSSLGSGGMMQVLDARGNDITDSLTQGDLGGTLVTRDQIIDGLLDQVDQLAYDFATAFNSAQTLGYDANGDSGTDIFTLPTTSNGAAASISIAFTDSDLLAASSDGSSGSNGNLENFMSVQTTELSSGKTPTDTYASIVYQVGSYTANAQSESDAAALTLNQLTEQRNAVSGVSVDEEATNLVQYQQAYSAAAHVVTTVQELYDVLMNMF